ncbi:MAG: class I SAM-dependent methyltransferase, partial [Planctomycetota bacterium]
GTKRSIDPVLRRDEATSQKSVYSPHKHHPRFRIMNAPKIIRHVPAGQICCDPEWEAAYERFETPAEEIDKFLRRLRRFGFEELDRETKIMEIFCGRGNGLIALERLGFRNVEGADLSDTLLEKFEGKATLHLADCMSMPFQDQAYDVVIVQGGLHHLPKLPDDVDTCLREVRRILRPDGRFYVVEPWRTPFLTFAHAVVERPLMRRLYAKGDALAAMTDRERVTYEQWLGAPKEILKIFESHFAPIQWTTSWGKLTYVGKPRPEATTN